MDRTILLDFLKQYNEHEQFYKEYYEASKDYVKLTAFLNKVDKPYVLSQNILVPDLFPKQFPEEWRDDFFFNEEEEKSVFLRKHYRYTPAFDHLNVFFEIKYVLSGSCQLTINSNPVTLYAGDVFMLSPATMHSVSIFDDSLMINILIRRSTLEDILFNVLRNESIISEFFIDNLYAKKHVEYMIFHTEDDSDIKNLIFDMYLEEINIDTYSSNILNSILSILFAQLTRKYKKTVEFSPTVKKLPKENLEMLSYIQNNYQKATLSAVAKEFNYSEAYCSRLIKSITGKNFSDLLRDIRLKRAEIMLSSTNMPISRISENIGYETPEAFIRAFKKRTGNTPSEYRSEANGKR